jgi:hypothetical protein
MLTTYMTSVIQKRVTKKKKGNPWKAHQARKTSYDVCFDLTKVLLIILINRENKKGSGQKKGPLFK